MKPRVSYAELSWGLAFDKLKSLPKSSSLQLNGEQFSLDYVMGEPYKPALWLKDSEGRLHIIRQGDPAVFDIKLA